MPCVIGKFSDEIIFIICPNVQNFWFYLHIFYVISSWHVCMLIQIKDHFPRWQQNVKLTVWQGFHFVIISFPFCEQDSFQFWRLLKKDHVIVHIYRYSSIEIALNADASWLWFCLYVRFIFVDIFSICMQYSFTQAM